MRFTTSTKNMGQQAISTPMNTQGNFVLVRGMKPQEERLQNADVPAGAHVFGIDVYVNSIVPSGSGHTNYNIAIQCLRSGQLAIDPIDFATIGLSSQRNQVLHTDMTQLGTEDAGPLKRKIRIKIPKIYRRIREGDIISLQWLAQTEATENFHGFRYKYYQ